MKKYIYRCPDGHETIVQTSESIHNLPPNMPCAAIGCKLSARNLYKPTDKPATHEFVNNTIKKI